MYLVRPNLREVNTWHDLIAPNASTAADNWSWDSLLVALKKSENFTPPISAVESVAGMQYENSSHCTNGPLQASYLAKYGIVTILQRRTHLFCSMVPVPGTWFPTMQAAGIPISARSLPPPLSTQPTGLGPTLVPRTSTPPSLEPTPTSW